MMQKEIFENITIFNQSIFNAYKEFFEINMRAGEKLIENQMKITNLYIQNSIKQMELARDFKDPKAYLASQSEIAKQTADVALSVNKDVMTIATDTRNELKTWFDKGVEEFDKGMKEVKKAATSASPVEEAA
ncbi:MAG: phasin family protein [Methylobacter sp.]